MNRISIENYTDLQYLIMMEGAGTIVRGNCEGVYIL